MDAPSLRRRYALRMDVGEVVFNKGEDSREIYYIVSGRVALYQKDRIVEIGDGSVFGEYSCVLNSARPFTAVCRTECELLKLPESIFRETIEVDGEFSRRTLRVIADYVRNRHEIPLFTDI
jgi:membrane protein